MRSSTSHRRHAWRWLLAAALCACSMAVGPAALASAGAAPRAAKRPGAPHARATRPSGWLSGSGGSLAAVPPAAGPASQPSPPRQALHPRGRAHGLDRAGTRAKLARRPARRPAGARTRAAAAHAAADPAVAIVDFAFHPGTITLHAGDTITWTNSGQQPHSATADNHSFDTGVLQHGQSASHTFTQPGTYTYFCIVHPFMRGTIVVLAATTTTTKPTTTATHSSGSPSTSSPTPASSTAPTASSGPTLPVTGLDVPIAVVLAGVLLAAGLAIRVALR